MMRVKFSKEQTDWFDQVSSVINTASGDTYQYLPYWFKKTDEEGVYDIIPFEMLPGELIALLSKPFGMRRGRR